MLGVKKLASWSNDNWNEFDLEAAIIILLCLAEEVKYDPPSEIQQQGCRQR